MLDRDKHDYVISYDLGTGGLKAGLYRGNGQVIAFDFHPYPTYYPQPDWHEQHPRDWWQAFCTGTRRLFQISGVDPSRVAAVAASGHSLVAAPIDERGRLLLESVPIWSDRRAKAEAAEFFRRVDYKNWYMTTGNGDPAEIYSTFKLLWLKNNFPDIFAKTSAVLGSKDFINFCLTGRLATDFSYASGSGVFDLQGWRYNEGFIAATGLPRGLFLEPYESQALVGTVTPEAAEMTGLARGTKVICGGVDNSCMALGTTGPGDGRVYTSLGSSAWIAVTAGRPTLDAEKLPFIFAHVEKGFYTSGVSIFAAAAAYRWARETFCRDLPGDAYQAMNELAATSPVGANGVMFNPALAGGSSQEPGEAIEGAFFGLKLSTTRGDLLRAVMEGVALSLGCFCLPVIAPMVGAQEAMIVCGGGAKSDLWMQIFADVFIRKIVVSNVDQDAASLGAAAIALRGSGLWADYSPLQNLFSVKKTFEPIPENRDRYAAISSRFTRWVETMAGLHESFNSDYPA